ncbi:MAG: hypothetical protein AAB410_02300 [Patescibacteria group bacterium]
MSYFREGKRMRNIGSLILLFSTYGFAQDWQNRDVLHLQVDVSDRWFIPAWSITNLRTQTPSTTNLFAGIGRRGNSWWLEGMIQRQWNPKGNQWMLDVRFDKQSGRWRLYTEGAVFLTKQAFYEFVIVERRVWKGLAAGAETENLHQLGRRDTVQIGPRASRKLGSLAGFDVSFAGALRFSLAQGHTEPRLYLVFNRRFTKGGRK